MTTIMLMLLLFGEKIPLEFSPTVPGYTSEYFQLAENGIILINDYKTLFGFNTDGTKAFEYTPGDNFWIANFTYIENSNYYVACILKKEAGDNIRRLVFFDQDGETIGHGFSPDTPNPREIYFRQIIPVEDRIFTNIWRRTPNKARHLREIQMSESEKGFQVTFLTPPFDDSGKTSNGELPEIFKRRWAIPYPGSERILLVNELDFRVDILKLSNPSVKFVSYLSLKLPHAVEPYEFTEGDDLTKKEWYYSFSRITGLYGWKNKFIVSYETPCSNCPNRQYPFHASVMIFTLDGKHCMLDSKNFPSAFVVGVHKNDLFTFHTNEEGKLFWLVRSHIPELL